MHLLLVCETKLLIRIPIIIGVSYFKPTKNLTEKPVNVKEFDNFFPANCLFFNQVSSVNSVFLCKMLNFAISSIFHRKQFCSVPSCMAFLLLDCIVHCTVLFHLFVVMQFCIDKPAVDVYIV